MSIATMQCCIPIGISLPQDIVTRIDAQRGDVSRSRWVLRLLQRVYFLEEGQKEQFTGQQQLVKSLKDSFESRIGAQQSNESKSL
jgi:metal-responsive CopG/Arc/MetJ family transcriptional regulator